MQSRPDIFDLRITCPDNLYEDVVEVDEAVCLPITDEEGPRNGRDAAENARCGERGTGRVLVCFLAYVCTIRTYVRTYVRR